MGSSLPLRMPVSVPQQSTAGCVGVATLGLCSFWGLTAISLSQAALAQVALAVRGCVSTLWVVSAAPSLDRWKHPL